MTTQITGNRLVTPAQFEELRSLHAQGRVIRNMLAMCAAECCEALSIDPNSDSVIKDMAEEIVFHGTSPADVIEKIQKRYEGH